MFLLLHCPNSLWSIAGKLYQPVSAPASPFVGGTVVLHPVIDSIPVHRSAHALLVAVACANLGADLFFQLSIFGAQLSVAACGSRF